MPSSIAPGSCMDKSITIELIYALPHQQTVLSLTVPQGASVCAAIELSGVLQQYPDINLTAQSVGIFGEPVTLDTVLAEGDRVEIYRPLSVDPMEARRLRAKKQAKVAREAKAKTKFKRIRDYRPCDE